MRHPFFGLLLTCIVFGASAGEFASRTFYVRRALAAETAEDASTTFFFAKPSAPNPFTLPEMTPFALPRTTETATSTTKHSHGTAPLPTSRADRTAKKERPSVAEQSRSESRSLCQDDGRDDNLTSKALCCLRERLLDASALGVRRSSLFAQRTNHRRTSKRNDENVAYQPFASR